MTLVGILSDTHGRLDRRAYDALAGCDHIIHAGDICGPQIIRALETLAPVTAVLGNNDFDEYGSHVQRFARPEIDGTRFLVAHFPHDVDISTLHGAALAPGAPIPHICVHGHTHVPRLEWGRCARPADYILNPGSATLPRGGNPASVAFVGIDGGRVQFVRIESLDGETLLSVG